MGRKPKDITGQRFGKLVATASTNEKDERGNFLWLCKCDCGSEKVAPCTRLVAGGIMSCGCSHDLSRIKNIKLALAEIEDNEKKDGTVLCLLDMKIKSGNTSGAKGVSWNKRRSSWEAYLNLRGKRVWHEYFRNKQDAINARKEAEEKYFKPILEKYGKTQ